MWLFDIVRGPLNRRSRNQLHMSNFKLRLVVITTTALLLSGVISAPQEEECRAADQALSQEFWGSVEAGPEEHNAVFVKLEALISRFERHAPICAGVLHERAVYLLLLDKREMEVVDRISQFLDGYGQQTSYRSRMDLLRNRGYALSRLGETREGSQDVFAAAALADKAPADDGAEVLVFAARKARVLGDLDASQRYLDSAFRLINDSLSSNALVDRQLGFALTSQSFLINERINATPEAWYADSLNQRLSDVTQQALEALPKQGKRNAGLRSLVINLNALAAARRGDHVLATQQSRIAFVLAEQAGIFIPGAVWDALMIQVLLAEYRGDLLTARSAAEAAQREAIRISEFELETRAIEELGRLSERMEEWDEAVRFYTQAIQQREMQSARLGLQDWSVQTLETTQIGYRGLARAHQALGDSEAAFLTLDRTRAQHLRDLRHHLDVRSHLTTDGRREADSLQTALESARLSLLHSGLSASEQASITLQISAIQEKLESITVVDTSNALSLSIRGLQEVLRSRNQTLLSYFINQDQSVVYVITPDTFVTVPLQIAPRAVEELLEQIGSPWQSKKSQRDPAFGLNALHKLYSRVFEPVVAWLSPKSSIIIVPDGPLAGIPFGMLTSSLASTYQNASYLVLDYAISVELAAALIVERPQSSSRQELSLDLLALGRSEFGRFTWNGMTLPDLPLVQEEIRRVSKGILYQQIALNDQATEKKLAEHIGEARVIHIASHAETDSAHPLYSRIALWEGPDEDGVLYLYELQGHSLPTELVVLSGCSTARGKPIAGEGMVGLQYAVRSAGAKSSLATFWPVDDKATVDIMGKFYEGLKAGLPKDVALQKAQIEYLQMNDGIKASPFFWAGPVLSGDTSPVAFQIRGQRSFLLILGLILYITGIIWHLRYQTNHG